MDSKYFLGDISCKEKDGFLMFMSINGDCCNKDKILYTIIAFGIDAKIPPLCLKEMSITC